MDSELTRVHIIAMGGSVMHALAIALKKRGVNVTGSDDEFRNPSKSRLEAHNLLPEKTGWHPELLNEDIDVVILGMHAHADNPELVKAKELGLKITSMPEFIYHQSLHKQRIVVAGSHGKTTITSMIMHVLKFHNREFDYVVGAKVNGFEETVKLSDAPVIVIEGDEYLSSRIDNTPKFLHYHHHIGLISGIAWDHVNVFPSESAYNEQFEKFAAITPKAGSIVYNAEDPIALSIGENERQDVVKLPYSTHPHELIDGDTYLINGSEKVKLNVFGKHNLLNLNGAKEVLSRLSITNEDFYCAIASFELPHMRLDVLKSSENSTVYRDYAHAPSKVEATVNAVREQSADRELIGVFELHTYSSLNKDFFQRYKKTLNQCGKAIVFYSPKAVEQKKLPSFNPSDIEDAFDHPNLKIISDPLALESALKSLDLENTNLLLMSSSNFGGIDLNIIFN